MSESEFAAAMRPKSYGSSTIGVKKSTVSSISDVGRQPIDGCVIARLEPEHELLGVAGRDLGEDRLEVTRTPLGGSTGLARELREPYLLAVVHRVLPSPHA